MLAGQEIWLVEHPSGFIGTRVLMDELDVRVDTHCPPVWHCDPWPQQPAPRDDGHWNCDSIVQARGQHCFLVVTVVVVPEVIVSTSSHWYCCSLQGELQLPLPMRQQAAFDVSLGST